MLRNLARTSACGIAICFASSQICADEQAATADNTQQVTTSESKAESKTSDISVEIARERATVTQDIYAATLRMLHHRYFRQDKKVLPARAMQDIFADIESQTNVKARWISASLKPMSIDHTPETEFEKKASKEIAAGTQSLEIVENDHYHRAVSIPMTGGCLGCP